MFSFLGILSPALLQSIIFFLILSTVLLSGLVVYLFVRIHRHHQKLQTFFAGKNGSDLESILREQLAQVRELDQEIQELFEISNRLRELGLKSLHKTQVVRFNPFKEVGGNQSFSVVLLDGRNSGVVVSSLHTREGTRVYAKPVLAGEANGFPFTEEEKKVITQAITGKPGTV
ncbi:MAG: DUF4446 family protein [Candidatus Moranbacteria bacterium]|nr:DUF4446 family protein [Candidatus Moranbacteria bacterium]